MPAKSHIEAALLKVTTALPGGREDRPGQEQMALAVANAIRTKRHLVVQAGTGTGKSLGYLVPSILLGANLVVATATKALQDQLANKDLPFLQANLEAPFTFAVLKGRSNYLCRQRVAEMARTGEQLELAEGDEGVDVGRLGKEVRRLAEWAQDTPTGDRAELDFEPSPRAWAAVSVTSSECPGSHRCPSGDVCLAEEARRRAAAADVIVVNTHLYGAHLASGGVVLPPHEVVVFDEAHELEDVAAASLGIELTPGRLFALARSSRGLASVTAAAEAMRTVAGRLENALASQHGQRLPKGLGPELAEALGEVTIAVDRVTSALRGVDADEPAKLRCLEAASHLHDDLVALAALDDDHVAWVEGPAHHPVLRSAPVEVGPLLADSLWGKVTAVLTSATIPPRMAERVGMAAGQFDQMDVGSPFPYESNGLLYCAADLPDPRQPGAEQALHAELERLIRAAGGRTLALFTSWRAMRAAAEALGDRLPYRVMTQSDLPKPALVTAFQTDEQSCLFATVGFWQGVDVPGPALGLVTIDRIPFPRPDDPLTQARRDKAGASAFRTVDIPRAATLLAQGAGRLIRSASDRGVVAVLDPRLARASYRWDLVRALPPMRRTRHFADVVEFFAARDQ